jgi:REP element-mobilizing transposase RayT
MARIGRFVVENLPHHVTQRGNRRERVFFSYADYELYRDLLCEACARETVAVWSYCLMPNHVHFILTPATPEGLGRALGKAHRRDSAFVIATTDPDRTSCLCDLPFDTMLTNCCVNGAAMMGWSFGTTAWIARVRMCASSAA